MSTFLPATLCAPPLKDGVSVKKIFKIAIVSAIVVLSIVGCSTEEIKTSDFAESAEETAQYFESNECVNNFFEAYNNIAELQIPADIIKQGNITTKANVYIDNISITVIDVKDCISIRLDAKPEDDIFPFFRDFAAAINPNLDENEIEESWENRSNLDNIEVSISKTEKKAWFELKELQNG